MEPQLIKYIINENVAIITLNRPHVLNSINALMAGNFQDTLKQAKEDNNIRAILITGEGKAFCAGQDLSDIATGNNSFSDVGKIVSENYNPIIHLIREIEKPVVCAVNGTAAGAGANIALACDIVVASENAVFIQAFSKIGLIPDSGGTYFLPRLAGFQRAAAMMMLGEKIFSEDALKFGMIYKIFPENKLEEEAMKIVIRLSQLPTKGIGLTKRALNQSYGNNLYEQLRLERDLQTEAGKSNDFKEGINSFIEKRIPKFTGD